MKDEAIIFDAEKTIAYLKTEEGQRRFSEGRKKTQEHLDHIRDICYIDLEALKSPVTI